MLQAQGIIPRDPPLGADRPLGHPPYADERARDFDYHARPQVKAEPRPLEERLGSEYYDIMQVEVRSYIYFAWLPD